MEENNKLIAEFMGWKIGHPELLELRWSNEWFYGRDKRTTKGFLHFNSDWNWLMEVVQKITDLNNVVEIHDNHVRVVSNERNNALIDVVEGSMLEATYNACVEFIKLYNQNK